MRTVVAFPGYRDPFYDRGDEVRSQDVDEKHAKHARWLWQNVERHREQAPLPPEVTAGPVATGLRALMAADLPADRLLLGFAEDGRMLQRVNALKEYATKFMNAGAQVHAYPLTTDRGDAASVFRYDAAFSSMRRILPKIVEDAEGEIVGLLGPSTPQLNLAFAVLATAYSGRVRLVQVITPRFDEPALAWVNFDGNCTPDLRSQVSELERMRGQLAELDLNAVAGRRGDEEPSSDIEAVRAYELSVWACAVKRARAQARAEGLPRATQAELARILGCSGANVSKRLKSERFKSFAEALQAPLNQS